MIKFNLPLEPIISAWVSNYLTDRFQRVKIGEKVSSWRAVASGVPQGSLLGPILFCVFVDSLHSFSTNSITYKYADDVDISHAHFVRHQEEDKLQFEYDKVLEWSHTHRLPINEAKCCVLDINHQNVDSRFSNHWP